jgi:hypothetical protein
MACACYCHSPAAWQQLSSIAAVRTWLVAQRVMPALCMSKSGDHAGSAFLLYTSTKSSAAQHMAESTDTSQTHEPQERGCMRAGRCCNCCYSSRQHPSQQQQLLLRSRLFMT